MTNPSSKAILLLICCVALSPSIAVAQTTIDGQPPEQPAAMPKVQRIEELKIEGRKVVRYEHDSLPQWKYPKPQRDYFFVAYPKNAGDRKVPLRVNLHSAGGSGESEMPANMKLCGKADFYELYLDCRRNQANDWWWGAESIRKTPDAFKNELCPTEKRILATVAWTVSNFNIDPDRVYLTGISMGGSGALGLGLCHGDLFAAIFVTVPAGADHALFRIGSGKHPDPPPLSDFSAQNDGWSKGQEALIDCCKTNRYHLAFAWGPLGHINDSTKFNAAVAEFPWYSIRRNEAYPVFTNAASDNRYPGFQNMTSPDQSGQINGYFRWKNVADQSQKFVMELRLVRQDELRRSVKVPTTTVADLTFRRLQHFRIRPNSTYAWRMVAIGQPLQSGTAQADSSGILTIPKLTITATPGNLEVTASSDTASKEVPTRRS